MSVNELQALTQKFAALAREIAPGALPRGCHSETKRGKP
jgi:hypothetical protein